MISRESGLGYKLDAWRGGAALLVVLEHARALFVRDFGEVASPTLAARTLYFVSGLGHAAVVVFFVLSGFFVGGSVRRTFAQNRWDWRIYLTARLSRLWIVLIPALILGYSWDLSGMRLFPASPVYGGGFRFLLPPDLAANLSPTIVLGNAAFLTEAVPVGLHHPPVPALGSNGPLWSLTYEFGYYLLFPFCLLAARRKWAYGIAALGLGLALGWSVLALFPIWLMGAWLASSKPPAWAGGFKNRIAALTILGVVAAGHRWKYAWHPVPWDLALGAAFTAYLATLLAAPSSRFPKALKSPVSSLANMSYSLYLAHLPFLVWLAAASGTPRFLPDGFGWGAVLGAVVISLLYGAIVWWFTERRTDAFRAWAARRWGVV
ncbi:acyltransferase [soil metagenome]